MQELTRTVRNIIPNVRAIVLFGSHASGKNDDLSDIDLLIVTECRAAPCRRRFDSEFGLLDLHVLTAEELKNICHEEQIYCQSFYTNAIATGDVIYGHSRALSDLAAETRSRWPRRRIETSWLGLRFVLSGKISDLRRELDSGERLLLAFSLVENLLCVQSLVHRGWLASVAIMRRWLQDDRPQAIRQMDLALTAATSGDYELLLQIASMWLAFIGGPPGDRDVLNIDQAPPHARCRT